MGRKKVLEKRQARLQARRNELLERSRTTEDIAELRSINEQLTAIAEDLQDIADELEAIAEEEANGGDGGDGGTGSDGGDGGDGGAGSDGGGTRSNVPSNAVHRNGGVLATFGMGTTGGQERSTDPTDSVEYRTAFMNFVCRNVPIPAELRATTTAADAGAVIPTTILKEIIQKLESFGNVYALVRKLNVQGGVAIPISSLKPVANWVGEGASESQKLNAKDSVTFSYYGVECKISQSLLVNVTTLDTFQQLFVPLATEAIVKAIEIAIFTGNGTTQPLGILNDARVPEANVITMTQAEFTTWAGWHTGVKAKMKKAYRNGTFFMNQATFDGYVDGMVDDNGQPVGRTNYGIDGEETYRFMGKAVETVEDDILASWDDAAVGDVVAVFMKPTDYVINSNMQMTTVKWIDNDTNEVKNKCILICDGKLADANGVLIIKKGEATA